MTLDEAIKYANGLAEEEEDKCYSCKSFNPFEIMRLQNNTKDYRQLAEWLTELKERRAADVQPVDRWISVKDRLPEENILVLCYARSTTGEGNNYFLGALAHGEFWFLKVNDIGHVSCPVLHWEVTHWQPLPESPKED